MATSASRAASPASKTSYAASSSLDYRPSYLAAGIAALLVFLLYLLTLAPNTQMWDTSEYLAAAYVLGLPHPPGNPLFVLLGRVFALLPIAPNVAMRINILAALCGALSAGFWFLITERVLVTWLPRRWQRIVGGSLAALIGATAFTVWNQSVVNEKVYTIALLGIALVSWLMIRWSDDPEGPRADRTLVLVAYLLGLGYANHMAGFLALPAVGVAVLVRNWRVLLRWRLLLAGIGALVLGLTPFATQPIRAAYFPAINEGEPTGCRTKIECSCTFSKQTYTSFMYNFNREQYAKPDLSTRQAPYTAQVGMWWLYFKWQWLRDSFNTHAGLQNALAVIFLLLGLVGGYVHYERDRRSFWYFATLMLSMTLILIYYLNFKYGWSQDPSLGDTVDREVRDRDYFFIFSFSAWSVWAALGLTFVWETVATLFGTEETKVGGERVELPRQQGWLLGSVVLLIALVPLFGNWQAASRAGQTDTRDFAEDLLNSVEPYGILIVVGDNDTFPLWYAQEVEGIRKDVLVANTSLLGTDWYTRQLIRRPIYTYDAARGPAIYRGKTWPKPTTPPLHLTFNEADSVPQVVPLTRSMEFRKGDILATLEASPQNPRYLTRADILVLRLIADSYPERPVYFSRTSGGYGQELGLQRYLLTQGLARKLLPEVPVPSKDTLLVPNEGFFDVPTTYALWHDTFLAPKSLAKRTDWVDRASAGIPLLYVTTGLLLSQALQQTGQPQRADSVMGTTERIAKAVRLEDYMAYARPQPAAPLLTPKGDTR